MDWILEVLSLCAVAAIFTILTTHWTELPMKVPKHFGASGLPNGWGSKSALWLLPVTSVFVYSLLTAASRYQKLINIPFAIDRDVPGVQRLLLRMSIVLKTVILFVFAYITWASVNTALGRSKGLGRLFLPISLILISAPLVWYMLRLKRYRRS